MKRSLIVAAICLVAAPAFAGFDVLPVSGTDYLNYDVATGQITPATAETRIGPAIWSVGDRYVNYFWGAEPFLGEVSIDWGDIADGSYVGGFGFSEYTNSQEADGDLFALIISLYARKTAVQQRRDASGSRAYLIENVPASTHPANEFWGYFSGKSPRTKLRSRSTVVTWTATAWL